MSKIPDWAEREAAELWVSLGFVNDRLNHLPTIALALVAAEKRGSEWQPIETAPKDGTEFQAWLEGRDGGYWDPRCRINPDSEAFEVWGRVDYDADGWDVFPNLTPTHWMPPPNPPVIRQLGEPHV